MKLIEVLTKNGHMHIVPDAIAYIVPTSAVACHVAIKGSEESFPVALSAEQLLILLRQDYERMLEIRGALHILQNAVFRRVAGVTFAATSTVMSLIDKLQAELDEIEAKL